MMSYFLRGYSNSKRAQSQRRPPPVITFDPITQEVEWEHFKERLSMQWRKLEARSNLRGCQISHSDKSDNGRFELKVLRLPQSAEVHGIRAFQGHSRDLVSEETDWWKCTRTTTSCATGIPRQCTPGHLLGSRASRTRHGIACTPLATMRPTGTTSQHRCNRPRAGRSDPRRKLGAGPLP